MTISKTWRRVRSASGSRWTWRWAGLTGLPLLPLILSVACSAPETEPAPAVAVTVMKPAGNPTLVAPGAAGADRLYGGCKWLTRSGDAVVCFDANAAEASKPGTRRATMTVHPATGGEGRVFPLFVAQTTGTAIRKHPGFPAAQAWLDSHRIKRAQGIAATKLTLSADRGRVFVRFEGQRWTALLAPAPPRAARAPTTDEGAPAAPPPASCRPFVRGLVVLSDGTPAVAMAYSCGAAQTPARLYRMRRAATPAQQAAAVAAKAAKAARRAADGALTAAAGEPDQRAPERFKVEFVTTKGRFQVQLTRAWAPRGVDRFYTLVKRGFFRDIAFFRVVPGFMAQFGVHGTPAVAHAWRSASIADDPVNPAVASNQRGYLTFAKAGPNTRSSQLFINFRDNANLDRMGFPPIGRVVGSGMTVVDRLYNGYGEGAPQGRGPDQTRVQRAGNVYLRRAFPKLDYVRAVRLVP